MNKYEPKAVAGRIYASIGYFALAIGIVYFFLLAGSDEPLYLGELLFNQFVIPIVIVVYAVVSFTLALKPPVFGSTKAEQLFWLAYLLPALFVVGVFAVMGNG